jgi:glycosyltransferase involved in cell wall biosynthesis
LSDKLSRMISILIPAYNEARTIGTVLEKVLALPLGELEIVVVNDASTDDTGRIIDEYAQSHANVRAYHQTSNQGKTAAIRKAIEVFSGDIAVIQDADLEYDPLEIVDLVEPILKDAADVVYGSRFMVKKAARVLYFYHYVANKSLTFLSNLLTNRNMSDIETCYKAFRKEVIKPIKLRSRGFGMEVEITAAICKTRARTYEVPISYYGRTYEEGKKIVWFDGVEAIWFILYFNLIDPWTKTGKAYRNTVNKALDARRHD